MHEHLIVLINGTDQMMEGKENLLKQQDWHYLAICYNLILLLPKSSMADVQLIDMLMLCKSAKIVLSLIYS